MINTKVIVKNVLPLANLDRIEEKAQQVPLLDYFSSSQGDITLTFLGGCSNHAFMAHSENIQPVLLRLPGSQAELFVDRKAEKNNTEIVEKLGICPQNYVSYTSGKWSGIKIDFFLTGKSLDVDTFDPYKKEALETLRKIHVSGKHFQTTYNVFERILLMCETLLVNNVKYLTTYNPLKLIHIKDIIAAVKHHEMNFNEFFNTQTLAPCHNDLSRFNFYVNQTDGDETIKIIDWEFAGMNDPMFDIAYIANEIGYDTREQIVKIIKLYYGDCYTTDEEFLSDIDRVIFYIPIIDLKVSVWALMQVHMLNESDYIEGLTAGWGPEHYELYQRRINSADYQNLQTRMQQSQLHIKHVIQNKDPHIISRIGKNFSGDVYLTCETKALIIEAIAIKNRDKENLANVYVLDGTDSFFIFLLSAKNRVIQTQLNFRFQFILNTSGRKHDLAGDVMILPDGSLEYAILLDATIDKAAIDYLIEILFSTFSVVNKGIITNSYHSNPRRVAGTFQQQLYGNLCSVYSIDNVVRFSELSSTSLLELFLSRSSEIKNKLYTLKPSGLPPIFARLAQDPSDFIIIQDQLMLLDGEKISLKNFFATVPYETRMTYTRGEKKLSIIIEKIKESYHNLLSEMFFKASDDFFMANYRNAIRNRYGFVQLNKYPLPCQNLRNYFALLTDQNGITLSVFSTPSVASYRVGDITQFYALKNKIDSNTALDKHEKEKAYSNLKNKLFAIQEQPFNSNLLLKYKKRVLNPDVIHGEQPTDKNFFGNRAVCVSLWPPLFSKMQISYQFKSGKPKPNSYKSKKNKVVFFSRHHDIHNDVIKDPCPDAVAITTTYSELKLMINQLLSEVSTMPASLQMKGASNVLILYNVLFAISQRLDTASSNDSLNEQDEDELEISEIMQKKY